MHFCSLGLRIWFSPSETHLESTCWNCASEGAQTCNVNIPRRDMFSVRVLRQVIAVLFYFSFDDCRDRKFSIAESEIFGFFWTFPGAVLGEDVVVFALSEVENCDTCLGIREIPNRTGPKRREGACVLEQDMSTVTLHGKLLPRISSARQILSQSR